MYRRKCDGHKEYRARFRFRCPDGDVYPDGGDTPDDIFPDDDHDEADKVHEKEDTEPGPLVVRVLVWLAWFPGVTEFDTNKGGDCVRFQTTAGELCHSQ